MKRPCERCRGSLTAATMSKFNQQVICMSCKDRERKHPEYAAANAAELAACLRGDFNFPGVGCPADLYEVTDVVYR